MEGDPATLSIIGAGPFRHPFDRQRPAGGTDQRFLVPICRDQNQRLGRAVLLDAPTSHSRPFWWGLVAQIWLPPPRHNLGVICDDAKGTFPTHRCSRRADALTIARFHLRYRPAGLVRSDRDRPTGSPDPAR